MQTYNKYTGVYFYIKAKHPNGSKSFNTLKNLSYCFRNKEEKHTNTLTPNVTAHKGRSQMMREIMIDRCLTLSRCSNSTELDTEVRRS